MEYIKSFDNYINESLGDIKALIGHMTEIKEILATGDKAKIDALIKSFGGVQNFFETFNGAVESLSSGFAKTMISTVLAKNPKPIKKASVEIICSHLQTQYKAAIEQITGFKAALSTFASTFKIPVV